MTDVKTGKTRKLTPKAPDVAEMERAFIVSSSHLATPGNEDLSEFEFALTVVNHAFQRWVVRGMAAAGLPALSPLDALILHSINHRNREKSLSDLMFTLNLSERHYLNYAMKKLDDLGLVTRRRHGKEVFVSATEKGRGCCEEYARLRRFCLLELIPPDRMTAGVPIVDVAKALRVLTGFYEQASRSAASL
ncbi:winged helix DNA-binding protein [Gluconacetobacter azotocaptans]|uniref:Winged helix DNA-binding protein n=1 Tax=Gluconacetobacter azotocaptans TaxID=142834 RepID=A0A7W4PE01_9PROT|nr:winged helix DNA-binding protein [Gluconacetobacter azotocaptans]MBB2190273.1 winged helix DNA-binding protein [Gluconacetobacter azotocaptans]MBM9400694.1 winged helix DNA-binding protein [Gluconacetobacter azotocaptans]